jgi:hypothetical protein
MPVGFAQIGRQYVAEKSFGVCMSQITVTSVALSPEQLRAMMVDAVNAAGTMPPEVLALEILKRKETLTTEEVETLYGLNANTLRKRRLNGEGPAYSKHGDRVLYTHVAVKKYLESRRQKTHDQP